MTQIPASSTDRPISPYIEGLTARAPRPTDEQARALALIFLRARDRVEARERAEGSA